jgi:hypothetical protein
MGLTGCSGPTSTTDFVNYEGANSEYQAKILDLQFPWEASAPKNLPRSEGIDSYESGFGVGIAERYWICAWEIQWLRTFDSDIVSAATAITQLQSAHETVFMSRQLDEVGRQLYTQYLELAANNDPSGIQQDVDQNCAAVRDSASKRNSR